MVWCEMLAAPWRTVGHYSHLIDEKLGLRSFPGSPGHLSLRQVFIWIVFLILWGTPLFLLVYCMYLEASFPVLCFLFVIVLNGQNSQRTPCLDLACPFSHPPLTHPLLHIRTDAWGYRLQGDIARCIRAAPHQVSAYHFSLSWVCNRIWVQDSSYHYLLVKPCRSLFIPEVYIIFPHFLKIQLNYMISRVPPCFKT